MIRLLLALALLPGVASAHPVYLGGGAAYYKADEQRLEVEISLDSADVEEALGAFAGRPIDLEKIETKALDKLLAAYMADRFALTDTRKVKRKLQWTGHKIDRVTQIWLFFTVPLPHGLHGATVELTALVDKFPKQMTMMRFVAGKRSVSHRFTRTAPDVTIRLD